MTPREVAAARYAAVKGLPRRVMGFTDADYADLHVRRLEKMRDALVALRGALGSQRFLASEWDDDALERAALDVELELAAETAAAPVRGRTQRWSGGTTVNGAVDG